MGTIAKQTSVYMGWTHTQCGGVCRQSPACAHGLLFDIGPMHACTHQAVSSDGHCQVLGWCSVRHLQLVGRPQGRTCFTSLISYFHQFWDQSSVLVTSTQPPCYPSLYPPLLFQIHVSTIFCPSTRHTLVNCACPHPRSHT